MTLNNLKLKINSLFYFIILVSSFILGLLMISSLSDSNLPNNSRSLAQVENQYQEIQNIFDNRCVGCHSCVSAPCEFNLQSYEGFQRGAFPAPNKLKSVGQLLQGTNPHRLGIDGQTEEQWRSLGFKSLNHQELDKSLFFKMIEYNFARRKDRGNKDNLPKLDADKSQFCPMSIADQKKYEIINPDGGMPYGLPPLASTEIEKIKNWLSNGASSGVGFETRDFKVSSNVKTQIKKWEVFFNQSTPKNQLVSRYLYEHLFSAHLYFDEDKNHFYFLVRSRTPCSAGIDEIATRRPVDDPQTDNFWYCFKLENKTIVYKNHVPYLLSDKKMDRLKELFLKEDWELSQLPSYDYQVQNPFKIYKAIPIKSRYQFLLDDARYHIQTVMKGTACYGNLAANSIDDFFYMLFIKPDSDITINSSKMIDTLNETVAIINSNNLELGKEYLEKDSKMQTAREDYREQRASILRSSFPSGYNLDDLWYGDNHNPNAFLSIFRHFDNVIVEFGATPAKPRSVFVFDYALLERLLYNVTIQYDYFGKMGHQRATRIYMEHIRVEAEDNFLYFMPPKSRQALRKEWHQGLTSATFSLKFPLFEKEMPINFSLTDDFAQPVKVKNKLLDLITEKFSPDIIASRDYQFSFIKNDLKKLTILSEHKAKDILGIKKLPELSFIIINSKTQPRVYSMIKNRDHLSLDTIVFERLARNSDDDNIIFRPGLAGAYPNLFFSINEDQIDGFIKDLMGLNDENLVSNFRAKYAIERTNTNFWQYYDFLNSYLSRIKNEEAGIIDLIKYDVFQ